MPILMTPTEASKYLAISIRQLRDLTDEGQIRWVNIGIGTKRATRRYTQAALDEFIAQRSIKAKVRHSPLRVRG